jgi:hypothetical protein
VTGFQIVVMIWLAVLTAGLVFLVPVLIFLFKVVDVLVEHSTVPTRQSSQEGKKTKNG